MKGRRKKIKQMASVLLVGVLRKLLRKHHKQNPYSDFLCHFLSDAIHCSGPIPYSFGGQWELDHTLLRGHFASGDLALLDQPSDKEISVLFIHFLR